MSELNLDQELKQILWACLEHYKKDLSEDKVICFSWVNNEFSKKFGNSFHQSKLKVLEKEGFLFPYYTARGGNRRYYKIIDPEQVESLLLKWEIS